MHVLGQGPEEPFKCMSLQDKKSRCRNYGPVHPDKTVSVGGQGRFLSQYQQHVSFRVTIRNKEMC